jgi:hypothetical protein
MLEIIARTAPFALATAALVGCTTTVQVGGSGGGGAGAGTGAGGQGSSVTATATSVSSGETTTGAGMGGSPPATTGSGLPGFACSGPNTGGPSAACTPKDQGCNPGKSVCAAVEVVDGAPSFALKMAQVNFTHPAAFTKGIGKSVLQNWMGPQPPICHVPNFLLAWILQFDLAAGTLTTGGAIEGAGQAPGFQLINGTVGEGSTAILPVTAPLALGAGCDLDVAVGDVNVPLQYDANSALSSIYLPFRHLRFKGGKVSPDHNCIGVYNEALLDPVNNCAPTATVPAYNDGAELEAMFPLEDADQAIIGPLQMSLCLFLTQNTAMYGTQTGQYQTCARDASGKILFPGDWCSVTDQPATASCADAVHVSATFAASGVRMAD